ncbi:MAG TPA: hypothetical protein VLA61_18185 [Ideonella sp.]|uniref:hypothetical protein n=1 Tax=Ideonella sp. TaxID=1929293 RepID=UPI002CD8E821|nr:hypothetical protein [Ideonella sp.]HSI50206.1 hypothetical protein [Ideonella sp.]
MDDTAQVVEQALANWKASLDPKLELGGLYVRNPTAHKWKAPFRSLMLRESVFWRLHDLLVQSHVLFQAGHVLGARILLRSGFETLALLIYLNQLMAKVLDGTLNFHTFSEKTSQLLLGSKDRSTNHVAINIVTVLGHCDKRYPGLVKLYGELSESAHPNYEGICIGYSTVDHDNQVTNFANMWAEMYGNTHLKGMRACMVLFEAEYNEVWPDHFDELERWIEANDVELEATKGATS